ncbi:hypothetical protein [Runella aurantiaca]|nr:hypothetical protein [Runella aurantiaca]
MALTPFNTLDFDWDCNFLVKTFKKLKIVKINHTLSLFLVFILAGCAINREAVIPQTASTTPQVPGIPTEEKIRTASGEWTTARGGAGGAPYQDPNLNTFKNFQYTFDVVGSNKVVKMSLSSSDIDVQFALYNPLGELIGTSSSGRSSSQSFTLNEGKYRAVVCAARRAVGKFVLNVVGVNSDLGLIPSQTLQSDTQNWGPLGGGGKEKTFKNHFYTFEITDDNTSIDVELESPDTDIAVYIYDELGQVLNSNFFSERYRFLLTVAKKGVYTIMAATGNRGSVGSYRLNIFGKVNDLKRVESQVATIKGNWINNNSVDTYSLQLNPNSSPLDIEFSSADAKAIMDLQNNVGSRITYTITSKNTDYIVRDNLPKGEYRIIVYPGRNQGAGAYTLNVYGQFSDLKKL